MTINDIIDAFICLKDDIKSNIHSDEYRSVLQKAQFQNAWFTDEMLQTALLNLCVMLDDEQTIVETVEQTYKSIQTEINISCSAKILIVCAGNIPAVAFQDIMCVMMSGNKAVIKLSSSDSVIIPFLLERLKLFLPQISNLFTYIDSSIRISTRHFDSQKMLIDGVIATGSNNSSIYFEQYFRHLPHIIRKNRQSVAVITDKDYDLTGIEDDIFLYFGLGCRNISHIFVPNGYDFSLLQSLTDKYLHIINHNKYRNNYDYQKAIMTLNNIPFIDTSNLLLRQNAELYSPISVVNYSYYTDITQIKDIIMAHQNELQCVVCNEKLFDDNNMLKTVPFGSAQRPEFTDFADGINIFEWLNTVDR